MDHFNDYLNEYQAIGVGPLMYDLIYGVTAKTASFYPPLIYSPNGVWDDDAISDICNDFILNKLLKNRWLDSYFLALDSINGLKNSLQRDFKHYLSNKKVRTEKNNLYMRVLKILRDNPDIFKQVASTNSGGSLWGLSTWASKEAAQDIQVILANVALIQLPRLIRYRPDSEKLSPLLRNPDLLALMKKIFDAVGQWVSLSMLFEAICIRLGVLADEIVSLDDPINREKSQVLADVTPGFDIHVETAISARQLAEDIFEQLSDRQREILSFQFSLESPNLVEMGARLSLSKSTVSYELTNIGLIFKENEIDLSDVNPVIENLIELLEANK